ncbi:hypothetical protein NL676_034567 [Syzygium grande]|nr:hypothetical protein NL676_034567 [Syzygium grande]
MDERQSSLILERDREAGFAAHLLPSMGAAVTRSGGARRMQKARLASSGGLRLALKPLVVEEGWGLGRRVSFG